jgi:hypothetical protein
MGERVVRKVLGTLIMITLAAAAVGPVPLVVVGAAWKVWREDR